MHDYAALVEIAREQGKRGHELLRELGTTGIQCPMTREGDRLVGTERFAPRQLFHRQREGHLSQGGLEKRGTLPERVRPPRRRALGYQHAGERTLAVPVRRPPYPLPLAAVPSQFPGDQPDGRRRTGDRERGLDRSGEPTGVNRRRGPRLRPGSPQWPTLQTRYRRESPAATLSSIRDGWTWRSTPSRRE